MKTFIVKESDIKKCWYVVDATDKVLGRLATRVATILMGKNKVIYSRHQDVGDEVIVINAGKVRVTGKKPAQKIYTTYSGYPGGLNTKTYEELFKRKPDAVVRHAVKGMLPKTKLGAKMLKKLRVYADDAHPHQAQMPKTLNVQ